MINWILGGLATLVVWFVGGLLWNRVIRPYFRREEVIIRTSVMPHEHHEADKMDDNICCICLAEPKRYRVVATCSHSFCADCIFGYYRKNMDERIDCPLCRKDIITLFKAFQEKEPAEKIAEIRHHLTEYNRKFGDDRSIKRTIKELPFVLVRIMNYLFSNQFLLFFFSSAIFLKAVVAIVVYQLLPYDIMPSALLGSVGYVDNTLVIVVVLAFALGQAGLQFYVNHE
jgi:uncharacterized membrane protein YkvA (DUF1232 family)